MANGTDSERLRRLEDEQIRANARFEAQERQIMALSRNISEHIEWCESRDREHSAKRDQQHIELKRRFWWLVLSIIIGVVVMFLGLVVALAVQGASGQQQQQNVTIPHSSDQKSDVYMTAEELAVMLNVTRDTVYRYVRDGKLPDHLYEPREHQRQPYRFRREAVEQWSRRDEPGRRMAAGADARTGAMVHDDARAED